MVSEALRKLMREWKLRDNLALSEQESRRLQEVRAAFYEGMIAGNDQMWMERDPDEYWLESDARRTLYAGPPLPLDPASKPRLARSKSGYRYDPQRDPGRVIAGYGKKRRRRKRP